MKKDKLFSIILNIFFVILCVCFVVPLLLIVSTSFTSESWVASGKGFSIFPKEFTVQAYKSAFGNGERVIRAYVVTILQAVLGTVLNCIVGGMIAYSLSRTHFRFRKPITFVVLFTMLFSAGMIPSYLIMSRVYHISNTFWIYILPGIHGGAWNIMVFRTFFKSLPEELFESAYIDGAKELKIFYKIALPLSKPVFASIGFMTLVSRWNNYTTSMIYIRDEKLYTVQYLLQRLMKEASFLKNLANNPQMSGNIIMDIDMPSETLRYAFCVIAAGPMLFVFPFFQKYFAKGLTIGAVKG